MYKGKSELAFSVLQCTGERPEKKLAPGTEVRHNSSMWASVRPTGLYAQREWVPSMSLDAHAAQPTYCRKLDATR